MEGTQKNREKGIMVELEFKKWLDAHKLPYWYIQQDLETFSPSLKKFFGAKRPDFMILLPNLGFILVDVEYKKITDYGTLPLDVEETKKYSNLQRNFNMPVWYALSDKQHPTWYWIPVSKVLEIGKTEKHTSHKSKSEFFAIPSKDYIQIGMDDSLERLFLKIFEQ